MVNKIEISKNYFQFHGNKGYPVFVRFQNEILADQFSDILKTCGFEAATEQTIKDPALMKRKPKVLSVVLASSKIAKQIGNYHEAFNKYGAESITPHGGYEVYRYRGQGIMVFARSSIFWELGVVDIDAVNFAQSFKIMMNRFLALALETYGVVSYWGNIVDAGIEVGRQNEFQGTGVFFDIHQKKVFCGEMSMDLRPQTKILRTTSEVTTNRKMSSEELYTYLSANSAYFSYGATTALIKDATLKLVNYCFGMRVPTRREKNQEL